MDFGLTRTDAVVALGGGVVGDPVSYTHLDVYKRQVQGGVGTQGGNVKVGIQDLHLAVGLDVTGGDLALAAGLDIDRLDALTVELRNDALHVEDDLRHILLHAGDAAEPVSYTHLDVYKRQLVDQPPLLAAGDGHDGRVQLGHVGLEGGVLHHGGACLYHPALPSGVQHLSLIHI